MAVDTLEQYVKEKGGNKVIRKILIANNGMAATKAIISMRQWAYLELGSESAFEFVVMVTPEDLDANAEFVRLADTYVEVPGGKNVNNYANVDVICDIAHANKVDAVWPGWGHASENPNLPSKLKELGITFIGPTSPVMSVLGDKIAANILAQTAGVSSIPWSGDGLKADLSEDGTIPDEIFKKGTINSVEEAMACADRIGYPVMLKASEGGGGKGIRMCGSAKELEAAYPQVIAEAPPGSPVFMMQLCQGARHIEVQIVGDIYGNAVALNGRDCSTQRRFQKIFEEGPPIVVPRDVFTKMERAAQRLTSNIGYIGAGTVEYLYNPEKQEYYFLELNPRLQVEHPVTEELTACNLPATQLQVLMGIPLQNMPQIRRLYGKAPDDTSGINFFEDTYVYPQKHVIAARITAENPDDGFKPTSGRIQRIKFQSSVTCWGYFAYGSNGAIHEYADSQFGHIFAHGSTREEARKSLTLALKNIDVVGEIRNPVEYLVELAGTDAFRDNTIDTSWLDGILKEKSVGVKYNNNDVVFYAAVFRAMSALKVQEAEILKAFGKGQIGPIQRIGAINSLPVEITFEGFKYNFRVLRVGADVLVVSIGGTKITAKVRTQPDGAMFVSVGNSVMKVFGTEEALGLRLRLEGIATVMVPTIFDATELRSEFNGKIVRYLQDNGGVVKEGEPYVELEAMKMIMPVKATSSGRITHTRGAGSIVSAGELLGSLELDDPSSVQKIEPFQGDFAMTALETSSDRADDDIQARVNSLLDGYASEVEPSTLVQALFASVAESSYSDVASSIVERYLAVEEQYAKLIKGGTKGADQQVLALISTNKDSLQSVASLAMAHAQLKGRNEIVMSTLRDVSWGTPGEKDRLKADLEKLMDLPSQGGGYDEVVLLAKLVYERISAAPFAERQLAVRPKLEVPSPDFEGLTGMSALECGVELLGSFVADDMANVRVHALECYVRRIYRSYNVSEISVEDKGPSRLTCKWTYQHSNVEGGSAPLRQGLCSVVPTLNDVPSVLSGTIPLDSADPPLNMLEILVGPDGFPSVNERTTFNSTHEDFKKMLPEVEGWLSQADGALRAAAVRHVVVTRLQAPHAPRHACFGADEGWKEDKTRRDMRPTFAHLMEVGRLSEGYDLTRLYPTIGRNSHVFLGVKRNAKAGKRGPPKTVFVRMLTHTLRAESIDSEDWMSWPETLLLSALDELERARLNPTVGHQPNSNLFANFMLNVDLTPEVASDRFELFMNTFVSKHGRRLEQMKVDEIVLKVGIGNAAGRTDSLRVVASSMSGEYLRIFCFLEKEDPVTGRPTSFADARSGKACSPDILSGSKLAMRRTIARAAGSTYAPEFLGMMKLELITRWSKYSEKMGGVQIPADVFTDRELVLGPDGSLQESTRSPGDNDIGMVAWKCTMRTPEYPNGRDIVLIANDVTFQAGSFGVAEDIFFQKASEYARVNGLPRIYIACNSGARVGLVEELKPYIKVKWMDDSNPSKGYEYLYLEEEDYKRFDEGVVEAREVTSGSSKHYALEAIIGEGLKSTAGGIGVENLQGSGLIAGETSRAYDEVFTLSYITGRSVGIGAYLNRLGQRTIQMVNGPMILTGFGALNKLLGKAVYTSQDQLGGPQVMVPNGVTHQLVQSDQAGVSAILDWLSFVAKDCWSPPPMIKSADPPERDITFMPSKTPYDPRHMLAGTGQLTGFFDEGTFKEYLAGWGKSVVVGRGKLGGIPMGVIAVETRNVDRVVPADPANPASQEVVEPQAGQVWFPDSAFKTATAIRDFNRGENLPLIIFANWRGFSGGTRDMYQEVLKFGAQIVDALVEYKHPVFVYIPPFGELRGGSWVVVDPAINPDAMEMYADVDSRGGILEPAGIIEVKFRDQQRYEMMHRLDPELQELDAALESCAVSEVDHGVDEIKLKIKAREEKLSPLYTQIACEFADLHDRAGRMQAKGVIRGALEWSRSREFFYWRVQRRVLEQQAIARMRDADPELTIAQAQAKLAEWLPGDDDKATVTFLQEGSLDTEIKHLHAAALKRQIDKLTAQLADII